MSNVTNIVVGSTLHSDSFYIHAQTPVLSLTRSVIQADEGQKSMVTTEVELQPEVKSVALARP